MLGRQLVRTFEKENEVLAWDREELDITEEKAVIDKIKEIKPSWIINAAAYNDVDGAEADSRLVLKINGDGPLNLAKAAQEIGAGLVHYSSDYVFDGKQKGGYTENDEPKPISNYGRSKLAGEGVLKIQTKAYVVRTSRLFGTPAVSTQAKKSFVELMLDLAKIRNSLEVINEEFSNPTLADDLAEQTRELVMGDYENGIYHATNEGACSWYELAQEIFKIKGLEIKVNPVAGTVFKRPAKRPMYSSLINSKLPKMRSWQEALRDYLVKD